MQPHKTTEHPPCFTVGMVFLSLKDLFFFCEHRADVTYQKASVLSYLSKACSPRNTRAWQCAFHFTFLFFIGVLLGFFFFEPTIAQKVMYGVIRHISTLGFSLYVCTSLEVFLGSLSTIHTTLGSVFLLWPGRLATFPWILNLIIFATVVRKILSNLENI